MFVQDGIYGNNGLFNQTTKNNNLFSQKLSSNIGASTQTNGTSYKSTLQKQVLDGEIQTGRVESGSGSSQTFHTINMDFEPIAMSNIRYQILPEKVRPLVIEDFKPKHYCPSCGRKLSGNENFCPNDGTKLS
jgi:hypothetical protein